MAYDFHGYIADLMLASQEARSSGDHGAADGLDGDLQFAIRDAQRVGAIGDQATFQGEVAHQVVNRGGSRLFNLLHPKSK